MNQKLPKDKAKLQYLTTIQKGWLPPIIEDLSGDDTQDASTYIKVIQRDMTPLNRSRSLNRKDPKLSLTPNIESTQLPQSLEAAASPLGSNRADKLPDLHLPTIQAMIDQLKTKDIPIWKIRSWLKLPVYNPTVFTVETTKEFILPTLDQWSSTLASLKYIVANWVKARKLYAHPEEHIHMITSGIDGSVWKQGVNKDSLN